MHRQTEVGGLFHATCSETEKSGLLNSLFMRNAVKSPRVDYRSSLELEALTWRNRGCHDCIERFQSGYDT